MKKYNLYIRNSSLFLIFELFIVLVCSLFNLFGMNSSITTIILFIINLFVFFFFGFNHGIISSKKGYLVGLLTSLWFLLILFLITVVFFKGSFNINMIVYYTTLILSSTLGGMIGKSKKIEESN